MIKFLWIHPIKAVSQANWVIQGRLKKALLWNSIFSAPHGSSKNHSLETGLKVAFLRRADHCDPSKNPIGLNRRHQPRLLIHPEALCLNRKDGVMQVSLMIHSDLSNCPNDSWLWENWSCACRLRMSSNSASCLPAWCRRFRPGHKPASCRPFSLDLSHAMP